LFGYVIANADALTDEEKARYKSVYCGLCHALGERHGTLGKLTLNYDMTFLILLMNSMYEPEENASCERCLVHPMRRHDCRQSEFTNYAADMNVALAYLNQLDNWNDDKNVFSLLAAKSLRKKYDAVAERWPRQCKAMEDSISALSALEKANEQDPDAGAQLFGTLMGELFVLKEGYWSDTMRSMAESLGEFIYIMDAFIDLPRDMKKGRYNPLEALRRDGRTDAYFKDILTMLIGNCTMKFESLPLVSDVSILRNILYSGVWTRCELQQAKNRKKKRR